MTKQCKGCKTMKVYSYDPGKKKMIEVGDYDKITNRLSCPRIRTVPKGSKQKPHFVWKYKGWGLQLDVYDKCIKKGTDIYIILSKEILKSNVKDWEALGVTDNLGNGTQRFLAESFMHV